MQCTVHISQASKGHQFNAYYQSANVLTTNASDLCSNSQRFF